MKIGDEGELGGGGLEREGELRAEVFASTSASG